MMKVLIDEQIYISNPELDTKLMDYIEILKNMEAEQ